MTRTAPFAATRPATLFSRAIAGGLAFAVTLAVLSSLAHTADGQYAQAVAQTATGTTTDVVLITGKRLPKA